MAISDFAGNAIAPGTTGQMIGYVEPPTSGEALGLDMYRFLIEEIRHADLHEGNLFLKRYLAGFQTEWRDTWARIFAMKNLWSATEIRDEHLQFLKNIVGWTSELSHITDRLDAAGLRRLIANSVALWRSRGPEDAIINVLTLVTGRRSRVWNWFQTRWIVGECALNQDNQGRDIWMISRPGEVDENGKLLYADEYKSYIRVVDDGTLDRVLVVDLVKLMRPASERYEIAYITFMELFDIDEDDSQWKTTDGALVVASGIGALADAAVAERTHVEVGAWADWTNYVAYWRARGTVDFGVSFYVDSTGGNRYDVRLLIGTNTLQLSSVASGVRTTLVSVVMTTVLMELQPSQWYGIRVQVTKEPSGTQHILVYVDNVLVVQTTNNARSKGAPGFFHDVGGTIEVDEVEMFQLPLDVDVIDINS